MANEKTAANAQVTTLNIRLALFKKSVEGVKRAGPFGKGDAAEKALDEAACLLSDMVEMFNIQYQQRG